MSATLVVEHKVSDYAAWRKVYDSLEPLRAQHGCTGQRVMQRPDDGNDLFVIHDFPSAEQAANFAHDPALGAGMAQAGVEGAPRIEIFTDV
jgi:quinol monooxygenase YgiN